MAIQYSISYDEKGNPSLTKNTIEGPKRVIETSFNIGKFQAKRTISDFANVSSFDDIVAERGTVNKSLQNYIYQNNTNTDGGKNVDQNKTFSQMDFEAKAVRGPDGKVIGGSTFIEKAKMAAVQTYVDSKLNTVQSTLLDQVPVIGTIKQALSFAGSKFVNPYYDPMHSDYYFSGRGMYDDTTKAIKSRDDRLSQSGGVKIGITSSSTVYGTDYQGEAGVKEAQRQFAAKQNEIGRALHGDGNGGGSGDHDGGASAGAQSDAAAGMGGY